MNTPNLFKKFFFSSIVAGVLLTSCGESSNVETEGSDTEEEMVLMETESSDIVFPSLLQIASIFKRSGLEYVEGIASSPSNIDNFESQMSKSLNFGVYSADLSYCVLNGQNQNSLNYLTNVKKLSDDLGLSSVFNSEDLFLTFENNLDNQDSLLYVISSLQERLDAHLQDNESDHQSSIYFAAGWIEAMYIATQSIDNVNEAKTSSNLVEQTLILDVIVRSLEAYPDQSNEFLSELLGDFKNLKKLTDNFDYIKGREIDDVPLEEIGITNKEFKELSSAIEQLRTKIINS